MPTTTALLTFIAALLILDITPGPDMMLVIARGIGQGRRIALFNVIGMNFVAGAIQVSLLVLGLASLLQAYPTALLMLQWVGAAYMLYLGFKLLLATQNVENSVAVNNSTYSNWTAIREGTINNLTNPKVLLFMFAFLPQFVDPSVGPVWSQLLILGILQKLGGLIANGAVALASCTVGQWLQRWPAMLVWQRRFTGVVMLGLGIRLLMTGSNGPSIART